MVSVKQNSELKEDAEFRRDLDKAAYQINKGEIELDYLALRFSNEYGLSLTQAKKMLQAQMAKRKVNHKNGIATRPIKNHAENNAVESVIFRKFDGEVIAFFPYLTGDSSPYTMTSYSHDGQHGAASEDFYRDTKKALSSDYLPLKRELHSLGYKLKVLDRMPKDAFNVRRAELQGLRSNPQPVDSVYNKEKFIGYFNLTLNKIAITGKVTPTEIKNLKRWGKTFGRNAVEVTKNIKQSLDLFKRNATAANPKFSTDSKDYFNHDIEWQIIGIGGTAIGAYNHYQLAYVEAQRKADEQNRKLSIHKINHDTGANEWVKDVAPSYRASSKQTLRPKRNATAADFKKHQSTRLQELSRMFQGEANGDKHRVIESDYAPKDKYRLGYLVQIKIKDGGRVIPINFNGETAMLAGDLKNNLWAVGEGSILGNVRKATKGQLRYLGEVTQVDYVTAKKHIEGGKTVRFYHKLGEVTGEKPNLFIDSDGFPVFVGGGYDIWNVGIVN